jgi:hypothetical protein
MVLLRIELKQPSNMFPSQSVKLMTRVVVCSAAPTPFALKFGRSWRGEGFLNDGKIRQTFVE